ncbi:unnamed protein product [Diabrotica balteata]|uniref:Uncharacterized protein n=1 Tax=Diabrotica balteata TaxID=107213 RepID=A0A9N9SM39_DIABA|nr:unnamed protein product [Diabrotica balteata]
MTSRSQLMVQLATCSESNVSKLGSSQLPHRKNERLPKDAKQKSENIWYENSCLEKVTEWVKNTDFDDYLIYDENVPRPVSQSFLKDESNYYNNKDKIIAPLRTFNRNNYLSKQRKGRFISNSNVMSGGQLNSELNIQCKQRTIGNLKVISDITLIPGDRSLIDKKEMYDPYQFNSDNEFGDPQEKDSKTLDTGSDIKNRDSFNNVIGDLLGDTLEMCSETTTEILPSTSNGERNIECQYADICYPDTANLEHSVEILAEKIADQLDDRDSEQFPNTTTYISTKVDLISNETTMPDKSGLKDKEETYKKPYQFQSDSEYDDLRDEDYKIPDTDSDTESQSSSDNTLDDVLGDTSEMCSEIRTTIIPFISEKLKEKKDYMKKKIRCKFCNQDYDTKNFTRHIERKHACEGEVKHILNLPKNSKERRIAFCLLRNSTNFDLFIKGVTRPNRKVDNKNEVVYYPCAHCKGLFVKKYLKRHSNSCIIKRNRTKSNKCNHISNSQTVIACAMDATNVVSQLNVKQQVFNIMKGDEIAFEAKKDILIIHFGESYLKKHKKENIAYSCSNRMRELSRLLISYRKLANNSQLSLKDILFPKNFDMIISAVRDISGYDPIKKSFTSPSLAMHLGTSLKQVCEELMHLILKECNGFKCESPNDSAIRLNNIKNLKELIQSRWNIELSSLANKDLHEKKWNKPLLLPLVSDIKKFRDEVFKISYECEQKFINNEDDQNTYKLLAQCSLALLILFNRRRIGDVQFLKVKDYNDDRKTNFADFENALTEVEKLLTNKHKRVVNSGKGSRAVVILVPQELQKLIGTLLKHREKYLANDNEYVFGLPESSIKWGKGDVAFRRLTHMIKLENPDAISSNKLRKHISTVMQIFSMSKDEIKQFSNFMGHTEKTHHEFYELPVDIYQTAKVSKILLMMEKGSLPLEYKGKSLSEINFDFNEECVLEEEIKDNGVLNTTPTIKTSHKLSMTTDNLENLENTLAESQHHAVKKPKLQLDDSDTEDRPMKLKKKRKLILVSLRREFACWSSAEINVLKDEFKEFINKKTYPSSNEIKDFLNKTNTDRSVAVIKSKIQHIIKTHKS